MGVVVCSYEKIQRRCSGSHEFAQRGRDFLDLEGLTDACMCNPAGIGKAVTSCEDVAMRGLE